MSDRDIPLVPVTTLAGLTSLSDLLSELPISDPLSILTSLNKTLLFHPRVAEEANNLLAVRDDSLVKPLVQAIEQTNSDNIELQDQYMDPSLNMLPSDTPQLLQAIFSYKPTVFDSTHSNMPQRYNVSVQPSPIHPYHNPSQETQMFNSQQHLHQDHKFQNQLNPSMFKLTGDSPTNINPMVIQKTQQQFNDGSPNNQQQLNNTNYNNQYESSNYFENPATLQQENQISSQGVNQQSYYPNNMTPSLVTNQQIAQSSQYNIQSHPAFSQESTNNINTESYQSGVIQELGSTPSSQKTAPRNNEYLEKQQQNKNLDIRGPSPAQATDAPYSNVLQTYTSNQQDLNAKSEDQLEDAVAKKKLQAKVSLKPLSKEDLDLMQKSLSKFAEKSPDLAKVYGIKKDDPFEDSMFSSMKADEFLEKKTPSKRKLGMYAEEPQGELFSKPKLRRIDRKILQTPPKLSKEDIVKSNTYIRFMSTMDQILEMFDETDAPLNLEESDENIDCIPTNMLTTISAEATKLKSKGAIDALPQNKLTILINFAMRSVLSAKNLSAGPDSNDDLMADECTEKILNAVEASLLICNIYTGRSTAFLQEDNIDVIIKFVQFQLRETIFPSYDPVYSVETKKKTESSRKKKSIQSKQKDLSRLYTKISELCKVFVVLLGKFQFEDTIIIHASALSIEPFFVDNLENLQFVCLDLVTTIFKNEKYINHRNNILGELLASIDRLPCSKRNLRPYKLTNNSGNIQMITALVLQIIQCSCILPDNLSDENNSKKKQNNENKIKVNKDVFVRDKYDRAVGIGGNFLSIFLNKCKTRSGEADFRPIFENFIHDLLSTVNKPEWPAAELLLSLLGTLLVNSMSDKSVDQALRVISLEYLGIVASRLRKDTVVSRCQVNVMDKLIVSIKEEQEREGDKDEKEISLDIDPEEERTEFLQRILLDFLIINAQEEDTLWNHARHFYLTQWYKDILQRKKKINDGDKGYASRKKQSKKRRKAKNESDSSENDDSDVEEITPGGIDQELKLEIFDIFEERKRFLLRKTSTFLGSSKNSDFKTYIDNDNAQLIVQYLASKRSFTQSFDKYLQKIILAVREPSIAIRTKAMKCLAMIVEVDSSILKRKDMHMAVSQKFLDTSISVREAAVDLVGKYVLSSPELINQYYEKLAERILDTGVSVRKRVIKILRDVCIEYPSFSKIPEICVKIIRRVNDEEGIQKLVTEVFLSMWFTPCKDNDIATMDRKIAQIIDVVNSSHDTGTKWLDGLLKTIFQSRESKEDATIKKEVAKTIVVSCQQIVDGLVRTILKLEEGQDNVKMLGCITTLHLFAKIRPQLLTAHAITLEPYLSVKVDSKEIVKIVSSVAEILEQVVPLIQNPSDVFLSTLEHNLMALVVSNLQATISSSIACLGTIINKITKNYKLIRDCFMKFYYLCLVATKDKIISTPNYPPEMVYNSRFRRSLYTVGLIMRYFDFTKPDVYGEGQPGGCTSKICDEVFDTLIFYLKNLTNDVRLESLKALGNFCVRNSEYLSKAEIRDFYHDMMCYDSDDTLMKTTVLNNIFMYLNEEEEKHVRNEQEWAKQAKREDLKEMGDVSAGMASAIIQLYLKNVLNCFINRDFNVRVWAVRVIEVVLRQGLVHPVQIVPYLICLSTDSEKEGAHCADHHLQEIDKQYPGFINRKMAEGIQLSFQLQSVLQQDKTVIIRGYRIVNKDEPPTALNGFLYSILRGTKPQRRALIQSVIKQFDDQKTSLRQMVYLTDNLAYFPYMVQDEPLYLINQIDLVISNSGTNLLSNFRDGLIPLPGQENHTNLPVVANPLEDDEEEEDKEALYGRLPEDTAELEICITASQGCMLLLLLKQQLKDSYGITDGKISQYSPSEGNKIYDKAVQRKTTPIFNPKGILEIIKQQHKPGELLSSSEKEELITRYLTFKQLMLKLDPDDSDADEDKTKVPIKIDGEASSQQNTNPDNISSVHVNNSTPAAALTNKETVTNVVANKTPKKRTPRKTDTRKTKKKRKAIVTSSEESDVSDEDY